MHQVEFYSSLGLNYEDTFCHEPPASSPSSIHEALPTHLQPHSDVLDVGCGTGKPVASALAAAGHHVTGIEISLAMVELSGKAVPNGPFVPKGRPHGSSVVVRCCGNGHFALLLK